LNPSGKSQQTSTERCIPETEFEDGRMSYIV
jgi:hypothetical protein